MTRNKKPYFPNNWKRLKDAPDDAFYDPDMGPLSFEEFMDWKISGWELSSSHCCIIRETNLKTGKVFEHTYKRPKAAMAKIDSLIAAGESEFIVCDESQVSHLEPKYNDEDDSV